MPPDLNAMLQRAIAYAKANRKAEARQLLEQIVNIDQMNEQAWLWLSACVDTVEEQTICLENVLDINPNNQKARKGLQALQARSAPPAADPFASSPFSAASAPDPFADSPFSVSEPPVASTPTSVEWGKSSGAEPARSSVPAFSDEDYDAWLASLPLGTSNSVFTSARPSEAPFSAPADQFTEDLDNFDFGSAYTPAPSAPAASDEPSEPFSFSTPSPLGHTDSPLFAEENAESPFLKTLDDEMLLEELQPDLSLYEPPESLDVRPFEEGDDAPLSPEDILKAEEPAPMPAAPVPPRPRIVPPSLSSGALGKKRGQLGVRTSSPVASSDPFALIPEEIQAPKGLPIQLQKLPLGLVALGAANAVALLVLIINLFA